MSDGPNLSRFQQLLAEKRARDAEEAARKAAENPTFDADLVPEEQYQRSEGEKRLDDFVNGIGIIEAYDKWCGKKHDSPRPGQIESIKCQCPNPDHPDEHYSAWFNTRKGVINCRPEGDRGFDAHDLAAFAFGFPVPDYKTNGDFPKLRKMMAESFGMHVERTLGGETLVYPEETTETQNDPSRDKSAASGQNGHSGHLASSEETGETDISGQTTTKSDESAKTDISGTGSGSTPKTSDSNVEQLYEDEESYDIQLPTLDWRSILPGTDTFLDRYMAATVGDEVPEEYHFFNGLLAIGFVSGREVTLASKLPVYGNLFLCHLGKTGAGKSTAARHLKRLMRKALPYDPNDINNQGVVYLTPSSAEMLIKSFSKPVPDPADPKKVVYYATVKGLIDYNEMSSLIGRTSRTGNILKPIMMDFYDMNTEIKTQSLSSGTLIAENPFASCTTTAQPLALRELLRDNDDASGFLNRWVFVAGTPKKITIMGTGAVDLDPAAASLDDLKGWCGSFTGGAQVTWSQESLKAMQDFFDQYVYPLKNKQDTNIYVRMDLLCMKLALLFSVNKKEKMVTTETVSTVKSMFKYLIACYGITADQMGNTLEHEITEAIVYQMRRIGKGDGCTINAIALALKRRKYSKDLILRNVKALIELGFVEERTSAAGTRGRPTKRYVYVAS